MGQYKRRTWRYDFIHKGIRHAKDGFKTKREARHAEADLLENLERPPSGKDLETLCVKRLAFLERHKTESYRKENESVLVKLQARIGNPPIEAVIKEQLSDFIDTYKSPHMRNYALRIVKAAFNLAVEMEWIERNPAQRLKQGKMDRTRRYIPPKDDLQKVLDAAEERERCFLLTLKNTLARFSEVSNLGWEDVDLEAKTVTLWTRKKRFGSLTPRIVPMTDELHAALDPLKPKEGRVFTNPNTGDQYRRWHKMLKKLCTKAGVTPFSWHAIRHWGTSTLHAKGFTLAQLQELLGHDNVTTTARYVQSIVGSRHIPINRLND